LRACGGVPRSQKVSLGFGGGLEEKYGLVREDCVITRLSSGCNLGKDLRKE